MKQFVVPQFIDVENKILGPITVRQFILLMVALLVSVVFYKFVDFILFIIMTVFDFGIAAIFAFVKVNGRPIHYFLINFLKSLFLPRKRVWYKNFDFSDIQKTEKIPKQKKEEIAPLPKILERSKLSEISLVVDTGGRYQGGISDNK